MLGFQGDLWNDQLWKLTRFGARTIWRALQLIGVDDPASPAKNYKKRVHQERAIVAWIKKNNQPTIIGHTHRPSFPNEGEPPYFNDGSCVHPRSITGIEIDQGKIQLIEWSVTSDENGYLQASKERLYGPREVKSLFT